MIEHVQQNPRKVQFHSDYIHEVGYEGRENQRRYENTVGRPPNHIQTNYYTSVNQNNLSRQSRSYKEIKRNIELG